MRTRSNMIYLALILTWAATGLAASDPCAVQSYVPPKNHFVLVIDRSGSMQGGPIEAARQGALNFIDGLKAGDECAIIAFSDRVELLSDMTSNKAALRRQIRSITPGGLTALYDAIAKAASLLTRVSGASAIVYLTDGADTGSNFTLRDLESMNIVEGVLTYGLGYGNVERSKLEALSKATGGTFEYAESVTRLTDIYSNVLNRHYASKGSVTSNFTQVLVRSMPGNLPVLIDGINVGRTPLNISNLDPGRHEVVVTYPKGGKWECSFDAKPSYRAVIKARESDLGRTLRIASAPKNASVFIDGAYIGFTSMNAVVREKKRFRPETVDFSRQLEIPYLPKGKHSVRIIAMPDFDFGGSQVFEFDIMMGSKDRDLEIDIFKRMATYVDGEVIQGKKVDPFEDF